MSKFHNPYHFVPVKKRDEKTCENDLMVGKAKDGQWEHHSHDRYAKKTFSGRLVCKLTTETPIFVGGQQVENTEPKEVRHFEMEGEPAIPGTSLRGLLSSIAEAASNSALRVLHRDRTLSYRYAMKHNMSALGMVVLETDDEGKIYYFMRPLALPSLDKLPNGNYGYPQKFADRQCNYAPMFRCFNVPPLKVFINRSDKTTFTCNNPHYYYLKLEDMSFDQGKMVVNNHNGLRFSSRDPQGRTAIGQKGDMKPLTEKQWMNLSKEEQAGYTRGIVRIMWSPARADDMPFGKKHELFIPYPEAFEKDGIPKFPISAEAVKRFHLLADERGEDSELKHPYVPIGTRSEPQGKNLRLRDGDIVYFVPTKDGTEVAEISFSSIWRGYAGTVEDYFRKVDPELLPFNKTRTRITPAELLFGFVQDAKDKDAKSLAFKGKVRISCGRLVDGQTDFYEPQDVTLKILSSPKPPSPALYFKPADNAEGGYIAKSSLADPNTNAIPQGRKMYLHHHVAKDQQPWRTADKEKHKNQKNRIKPLRRELEFIFSIDFDNLTEWELGLLCYAVRPMEGFRHKIGMGKPLGLGTVRIDPVELSTVDRTKRYSLAGFKADRFNPDGATFDEIRKLFAGAMDGDIKNALRLLGTPKFVTAPVHTPQNEGLDPETDTFKWFVANDDPRLRDYQKREFLEPLRDKLNELKPLGTPPAPEERGGYRPQAGQRPDNQQHPGGNRPGGGNRGNFRR
jgi:CRISPR-associated protein (TIGR03986 family)